MNPEELTEKITENLSSSDQFDKWDALQATDKDCMMYSPKPVGYNTTAEHRYLMQNLLIGFYDNSILDIGCGRADLYDFLQNFYPDSNFTYHGIDHNPVMTDLAKQKYGVECHVWKVSWKMGWHTPDSFVTKMKNAGRTQVSFAGKAYERWLCPSNPKNQQMEIESMLELVRNYDIDGIHFDYIRYPGNEYCFCMGCRERFESQLGRKIEKWPEDVRKEKNIDEWNDFRRPAGDWGD